jgi:hypothetical protein
MRLTLQNFTLKMLSLLALSIALPGSVTHAGALILKLGPAAVGNGGSNPLGIPPGPADMELAWISESNWETSVSVIPGLIVGKRHEMGNYYVGIGGGIIIGANGVGLGPYSSFGWQSDGPFLVSFEFKQALGFTKSGMISPYALRTGIGYAF